MIKFIKDFFFSIGLLAKLLYKLSRFVLMTLGVLSFPRCAGGGSGYTKEGGQVFYDGIALGKGYLVLNAVFAKNDSFAYFKTYPIKGADAATFTAMDENYAKDKNKVYYCNTSFNGINMNYKIDRKTVIVPMQHSNPNAFTILNSVYAKDDRRCYCQGVAFAVSDVATLEILDDRFLKDKNQVYYQGKPVKGSQPQSFHRLGDYYAQDTAQVYVINRQGVMTAIPCRRASFIPLDYPYSKDEVNIFYEDKKILSADMATFKVLNSDYSVDRSHVYYNASVLKGADRETFKVQEQAAVDQDAEDKNNTYKDGKKVKE